MATPVGSFLVALGVTAVCIAVTAGLGRRGLRRPHFASAAITAVGLGITIFLAERLGRTLTFPRTTLIVHLVFANLAAAAFLAVAASGLRLYRRESPERRRWHRRLVITFATLVAIATATGTYLLLVATPRS